MEKGKRIELLLAFRHNHLHYLIERDHPISTTISNYMEHCLLIVHNNKMKFMGYFWQN